VEQHQGKAKTKKKHQDKATRLRKNINISSAFREKDVVLIQ